MWISVILAITCTGLGTTGAQVIAPKLTIEPTDVVINPSSGITSVSFQCRATGDPVPQYLWFKEYVDLDTINRQPSFQTSGGTLTIPVPTATDQGRYWCQAYNEYGRVVSIGANLTFAFVDNFDSGPRPVVTTTSGNGTLLQCMPPNAYPSLVYHWIEAGQTSFIAHTVRRYASQKNGDYYFANVSPDDNGLYQCGVKINLNTALTEPAATGGFNEFSPETQLTVNAATPTPQAPQLVLFETVQYKKRGDNVLMEFFAYGNPTPTLGWRRVDAVGGNPVEFPASAKYEQWNRAMTLANVTVDDQGFYEVTATNTQGTDVKTAQLIIEDVPKYIKRLETQNLDQAPGEDVNLEVTWQDDGRNPVTPSWYYNGQDIVPDGSKYIVNNSPASSSLTVTNAQPADSGSYQSILQNQYGMAPSFAEVRVGAPGKVSNLKLVEKGDNSATLSWSEPPTKAELTGYQIQYYPTDNPDNVQYMDVGKNPTQATVLNSNPDISTYRVRAKTVDGIYGPYSDPLVNGKIGPVDTGRATGGGGVPLVAWLLPLLLLLIPLLLLLIFCCCCKGWCAGKKKEKALGKGQVLSNLTPMSRVHQEMLRTYRTTIVDNMKVPGKVTSRMANDKVINAHMVEAIASHSVRQDKSKKLLDSMVLGGDKSFDSFCTGLRKDEKLDWLADTLEGQGLSMDNRKRLEAHEKLLVNKMDPGSTLQYLTQNQIFTNDMAEYCNDASSTEEQNKRILHLMKSRSDEDFNIFCSGLRANGQQAHIADLLQGGGIDMATKDVIMEDEIVKTGMTLNQSGTGLGLGAAGAGLGLGAAGVGLGTAAAGLAASKGGMGMGGTQSTSASGLKSSSAFGADLGLGGTAGHGVDFKGQHLNGAVVKGAGHKYRIEATAPQGSLMSASSTVVPPGQPVILEVRGEVDQVQWLYNGDVIRGDPGITANSDGFLHELHIDRMSPERDGTYTCRGETPDGGVVACDIKVQTLV
ncbi:uncharacterized protein LOC144920335 isoform X3 [Branchiostoma floridae x Branchiostoma belcheri]